MAFYKKKKERRRTDVDITPLLDVIFLLLVFFMVATTFHEETRAIDVTLPRAENPKIITMNEKVLSVPTSSDDRFFLNEDEVEPTDLRKALNDRIIETGFKHVLVKGDRDAKYQNIAAVIDALSALEVEGISFAVLYGAF